MKKRGKLLAAIFGAAIVLSACAGKGATDNSVAFESVDSTEPTEASKEAEMNTESEKEEAAGQSEEQAEQSEQSGSEGEQPGQSGTEAEQSGQAETEADKQNQAGTEAEKTETDAGKSDEKNSAITQEQAYEAVKNYYKTINPDYEEMDPEESYGEYWEAATEESGEIVVIYRSYTGAINRYYVDPSTGETYVTEFVPGIIDEEQKTGETFNVKDYQ